jgi:hypothetical protein
MDSHGPHSKPWFGYLSVGPYKNFNLASYLGIRGK